MKDFTLKKKILNSLFESSKTTGELLVSLRYGKTKYNIIDKDLKKLVKEGLIFADKRKNKGSCGQPPTFYNVICELSSLQKILGEHSSLCCAMQKNDKVLSMLVETHSWWSDLVHRKAEYDKFNKPPSMCVECLKTPQKPTAIKECHVSEEGRQIVCMNYTPNTHHPPEPEPHEFLFNWDEIPENNTRLKEFLIKRGFLDFLVETAKIEKTDDGRTINIINEKYISLHQKLSITLSINEDKTEVLLKGRKKNILHVYVVKIENDAINIYDEPLELQSTRNITEKLVSRQNIIFNDFKDFLRLSPRFFELCLKNTPEELKNIFDGFYLLTLQGHVKEPFIHHYDTSSDTPYDNLVAYLQKVFEICVFHDIADNKATEEGKETVARFNKQIAKTIEGNELHRIESAIYYPERIYEEYLQRIGKFPFNMKDRIPEEFQKYVSTVEEFELPPTSRADYNPFPEYTNNHRENFYDLKGTKKSK